MTTVSNYDRTQFHEAGHVVVSRWARSLKPIRLVTVDLRGGSCGKPEAREHAKPEDVLYEAARTFWAGCVAETLAFGDSRGHGQDLEQVVKLALRWEEITRKRDGAQMGRRALAAAELLVRLSWSEIESLAAMLRRDGVLTPASIDLAFEHAGNGSKVDSWDHLRELIHQARGDRQIERVFANLSLPKKPKPRRAPAAAAAKPVTPRLPRDGKSFTKRLDEKLAERRGRRKSMAGAPRGYVIPGSVRGGRPDGPWAA